MMEDATRLASHNPKLAAMLSIVPGAGQVYVDRPRRGVFFLCTTLFLLAGSIRFVTLLEGWGQSLLQAHHPFLFLTMGGLSVVAFMSAFIYGLFMWGGSAQDAYYLAVSGANPNAKWWRFHY